MKKKRNEWIEFYQKNDPVFNAVTDFCKQKELDEIKISTYRYFRPKNEDYNRRVCSPHDSPVAHKGEIKNAPL